MENLKSTITKTDTLKNDLKLAKEKINDKILSGGGTIANTISEVPDKISNMLGQYRKVATGKLNIDIDKISGTRNPYDIKMNLAFKASRVLVKCQCYDMEGNDIKFEHFILDTKEGEQKTFSNNFGIFKAELKQNNVVTVSYESSAYLIYVRIKEWIAIE